VYFNIICELVLDAVPSLLVVSASTACAETYLRPEAIEQLRAADDIVNRALLKHDLVKRLSQVPVISAPCDLGIAGARCICLRPFVTRDFMTGVPAIPAVAPAVASAASGVNSSVSPVPVSAAVSFPVHALVEIVAELQARVPNLARVLYDLTPKPPGTTEWE
jgi:GMP synthase (glutamine-hydrolysing)